jgi:hypothetical protein
MKIARLAWYLIAIVLVSVVTAFPQTSLDKDCSTRALCTYGPYLQKVLNDAKSDPSLTKLVSKSDVNRLIAPEQDEATFIIALMPSQVFGVDSILNKAFGFNNAVNAWEQARVDKQIGATATTSGVTDLVSKPSTSEILGMALQIGALTETVSGNTATFQGNLDGIYHVLTGTPVVCYECSSTPILKNVNVSGAFDLNRPGTKTVTTSGAATPTSPAPTTVLLPKSSRQLSSLTARYDIYNPLDPRSPQFKKAWETAFAKHQTDLKAAGEELLQTLHPILNALVTDPNYITLQATAGQKIREAAKNQDQAALSLAFTNFFNQAVQLIRAKMPDLDQKVVTAAGAVSRYSLLNHQVVQEARGKPQFTFEYTFNQPASQPDTHDFRLIVGLNPSKGKGLFSLNLAGTVYGGSIPAGAKYGRVRDFQFAGEFDRPIGDEISHPATLSLAGYVQYQFDPSVLNIGPGNLAPGTNIILPANAQVLLGTKGVLGVFQGKLTINTKSGLNIPIGVSWANKTDLLNATDVRGHIGITYDFASITQLLGTHN